MTGGTDPRPTAARPSARLDAAAWKMAGDRLIESLRSLIRIPSINPPLPPGAEVDAARWIAAALEDSGLRPEVFEPVPGRGSVVARLRGDGSGGEPLLLLSHLDVVPAPPERWTHDPFAADLADGYVYGRGAVDMKNLVAMELEVVRLLAAEARAVGRDPVSDPIPGLRRDVLFACTADEEAGGVHGAAWLAAAHPEHLRAAGAINEVGGASIEIGGRRIYPIQVAEKGYSVYRITIRGTWGHGSMPRPDNAAVLAAAAITRLAAPGRARITEPMRVFFDGAASALPEGPAARTLRALATGDDRSILEGATGACAPSLARAARAVIRDTISPDIVHAGIKFNVIPGEAGIEIDCRRLPGTSEAAMRAEVVERLGSDLAERASIELLLDGDGVEAPADSELFRILAGAIADADPDGVALPTMVPFGTDAKHLAPLGVPTYGFAPLRQEPDEPFLERFHGVDERVSIAGLQWGLPVLYDAVRRYCE